MAEGRCYVCSEMFTAKDKDAVVDTLVAHMMGAHRGWVKRDALQTKNTFAECPVCGAAVGKLYAKCPQLRCRPHRAIREEGSFGIRTLKSKDKEFRNGSFSRVPLFFPIWSTSFILRFSI